METKNIILSICISTYNKASRVECMVRQLLQNNSGNYNIIVVDDSSTDNTIERLSAISDNRLKFYTNKTNLGAKRNWYNTINRGTGKYLLHLLDRDWIDCNYLEKILEILENTEVGFGYIGDYFSRNQERKSNNIITIFKKGKEALCEFACTLVHPTGFLVKKKCWAKLTNKNIFFEREIYGIYPHSYLFSLLALNEDAISIRYNMFKILNYGQMTIKASHFYDKMSLKYWWTYEAYEYEMKAILRFIYNNIKISNEVKKSILLNRFNENLYRATFSFKNCSFDIANARHYGVPVKYITYDELMNINYEFTQKFIEYVKKEALDISDEIFINKIKFIASENEANICHEAVTHKDIWEIVKFKEYYFVMDAWMLLKQRNIHMEEVFKKRGIKTIAIYGNGKFGKRLMVDLQNSQITVRYFIDKNASYMLEDVPVFSIDEQLPIVDAIIITIIGQFDLLKKQLAKVCNYTIMSLEDIIYSSLNDFGE